MPIVDHYKGGATERLMVAVITVNPDERWIEVVGKDAAVIRVEIRQIGLMFKWPKQGDYGTIIRVNSEWRWEGTVPENPDAVRTLSDLNEGEALIQAENISTPSGDAFAKVPNGIPNSPSTLLRTGQVGQKMAGRQLTLADFSTLCALPTTPVGLWNLGDTSNLGTGGLLTNKGPVTFAGGVEGLSNTAAQFTGQPIGSVYQAFYIADAGASDPFRIRTGTIGCWARTPKRTTDQMMIDKWGGVGQSRAYCLNVGTANQANFLGSVDGSSAAFAVASSTDVCDDRWHFIVGVYDGVMARLYVDGVFEGSNIANGPLYATPNAPFNIGARAVDSVNQGGFPWFGRIDEAFITTDVLSEDQIRLLYCAKFAHDFGSAPTYARMRVQRKRRGAALVAGDFPSQPKRLHSFTAGSLADAGSDNQPLTNNAAGGVFAPPVAGADGSANGAFGIGLVGGVGQSLSATSTGLPSGTASRSYGCWFKVTTPGGTVIGWGTQGTADARIAFGISPPVIVSTNGADAISVPFVYDGLWHHVVAVEDNAAADGIKRKFYLDGRIIGGSTVLTSLTLTGASTFRLGAQQDGVSGYFTGQVDEAFVYAGVLTSEQVWTLYQKSSQALINSPVDANYFVEAMDSNYIYFNGSNLDDNVTVELTVAR